MRQTLCRDDAPHCGGCVYEAQMANDHATRKCCRCRQVMFEPDPQEQMKRDRDRYLEWAVRLNPQPARRYQQIQWQAYKWPAVPIVANANVPPDKLFYMKVDGNFIPVVKEEECDDDGSEENID